MTVTDRTAPAPSPYEQSEIDRFGIFAEERVIEEVARALLITVLGTDDRDFLTGCDLPADEIARLIVEHGAAAAVAAYRAAQDGGAEEAVLVEGDWIVPSREAHARDLTKSWADAAQNAGCPAAFVDRMRAFVDVHDRNYRAALAPQAGDGR